MFQPSEYRNERRLGQHGDRSRASGQVRNVIKQANGHTLVAIFLGDVRCHNEGIAVSQGFDAGGGPAGGVGGIRWFEDHRQADGAAPVVFEFLFSRLMRPAQIDGDGDFLIEPCKGEDVIADMWRGHDGTTACGKRITQMTDGFIHADLIARQCGDLFRSTYVLEDAKNVGQVQARLVEVRSMGRWAVEADGAHVPANERCEPRHGRTEFPQPGMEEADAGVRHGRGSRSDGER